MAVICKESRMGQRRAKHQSLSARSHPASTRQPFSREADVRIDMAFGA